MSHFSVLVVGDVEYNMAPFHEFECTGVDDEFVVDVDVTEELRKEWREHTDYMVRLADGTLRKLFNEEGNYCADLLRPATEEERSGKTRPKYSTSYGDDMQVVQLPEGAVEESIPTRQTFKEFLKYEGYDGEGKYNRIKYDEAGEVTKVIRRTNPNKKWDYWRVGGRWSGSLKAKENAPGANAPRSWDGPERRTPGWFDVIRKGDVDWEGMAQASLERQLPIYERGREILAANPPARTWEDIHKDESLGDIDARRRFFHAQPLMAALDAAKLGYFQTGMDLETFQLSPEEFTKKARAQGVSFFAFVNERQWHQRGEMGWFGMVRGEKDTWDDELAALIAALPDDAILSVVDCHI